MNYYDRRRPRTFLRAKYRTPVFFVYALLILGVVIVCCLASWIGDGVGGIGGTLEHSIVDNNNKIPLVYGMFPTLLFHFYTFHFGSFVKN